VFNAAYYQHWLAVGCTNTIDSPHHSHSIPLSCRNSVNFDLPCK